VIFDHARFVFYIHLANSHKPTERALVRHAARQQPDGQQQDQSMRHRAAAFLRPLAKCIALLAIVAQAAALHAQATQPTFRPAAGVASAIKDAVSRVLESGRNLEISGRWADALTQ
jgi:hypothetical protein